MKYPCLVILTGAGISAESGLGTFRSRDGIWAKYDLKKVATPYAFATDPQMVHDFYNLRRQACLNASPHAGHYALARFQREWHGSFHLITQNIDDLHERAGSKEVLHMHGDLLKGRCSVCGHRWPAPEAMFPADACPRCGSSSTRPDVVWFGEDPYFLPEISHLARAADIFVVIGSSGQVYPAANMVKVALRSGAKTYEINLERTGSGFHSGLYGMASEIVPVWVERMLTTQV